MLLPVVFGRTIVDLLLDFTAGLTGLMVIAGLAAGLMAGACFGAGLITAGVDFTGFGRIGVSTFESVGPPAGAVWG
jgi:hypothetical protein